MPDSRFRRPLVLTGFVALAAAVTAVAIKAADHRDSTLLTANPSVDINDVYAFKSPTNPANVVLAMTVSPFVAPSENGTRFFEPNALYQIKIDTNGDAIEDLVIQAIPSGQGSTQTMRFFGPVKPLKTGATTRVAKSRADLEVQVSANLETYTRTRNGVTAFAGLRDDPFFFDLTQFRAVVSGQASSFRNPGIDTFAGFNTLAIVIELPAAMLGANPNVGIWATTSRLRAGA